MVSCFPSTKNEIQFKELEKDFNEIIGNLIENFVDMLYRYTTYWNGKELALN